MRASSPGRRRTATAVLAGGPRGDCRGASCGASCRAKAAIVGADEREAGRAPLLNLGHTFGHALEAETGFGAALLHGEAVAIGMVLAFDLSARLGLAPADDAARVRRHLARLGCRPTVGADRVQHLRDSLIATCAATRRCATAA